MGLKEVFGDAKLTQQEIASKLDVSQQLVSCWALGKSVPHPNEMLKLSVLLNTSAEDLLNCFKK